MSKFLIVLKTGKRFEIEADKIDAGSAGCTAYSENGKKLAQFNDFSLWMLITPEQAESPSTKNCLEESEVMYEPRYNSAGKVVGFGLVAEGAKVGPKK